MEVIEKLEEAIDILNEVDTYGEKLNDRLRELNSKQQDLLHYIECNKINMLWCYRMVKELKRIREERRKVKNDIEILAEYRKMDGRLLTSTNRKFLLGDLHKKEKQLQTTYKNKQYTNEDINNILKGDGDEKN